MEENSMTIKDKMIKIQEELKVPKNLKNKFGNYKYRNAEQILAAVKPIAAKYGCYIHISESIVPVGNRIYVSSTVALCDNKNELYSTGWAREAETKTGMDASQITGAATSYARKYALGGLFGIDDGFDADAMDNSKITEADMEEEPETVEKDDVFDKIGKCKTIAELKVIWSANPHLQKDAAFLMALNAKKEKLRTGK